jgi:gas vesicle protein
MRQRDDENDRSGFSGGQVFLGFLAGAAAGAAAAFLSAPRSGGDTRQRIRALADEGRERAQRLPEALSEATEAAREAFTQAMAESNHHPKRT